jgi:hypothetical protein
MGGTKLKRNYVWGYTNKKMLNNTALKHRISLHLTTITISENTPIARMVNG